MIYTTQKNLFRLHQFVNRTQAPKNFTLGFLSMSAVRVHKRVPARKPILLLCVLVAVIPALAQELGAVPEKDVLTNHRNSKPYARNALQIALNGGGSVAIFDLPHQFVQKSPELAPLVPRRLQAGQDISDRSGNQDHQNLSKEIAHGIGYVVALGAGCLLGAAILLGLEYLSKRQMNAHWDKHGVGTDED